MASLKSYNERIEKCKITSLIDAVGGEESLPRHYIGLSGLGGSCTRSLWFTFRWVAKGSLNAKTLRIFAYGHYAENIMIDALESIDIELWNTLEDQDEFVDCYGYAKGHPDGYCKNVPGAEKTTHLVEFKTMNDKSFNDTKKNGVKKSKPVYYAQMVLYMYKKNLTRALFMSVNKNNSEFYTERVKCDNDFAKELIRKGESIVFSENYNEFSRIGNNSQSWYECKWCGYNSICFGKEKVKEKNCRTCKNCNLLGDGKFGCGINDDYILSVEEQANGCESHIFMECFQ